MIPEGTRVSGWMFWWRTISANKYYPSTIFDSEDECREAMTLSLKGNISTIRGPQFIDFILETLPEFKLEEK